MGFSIYPSVYVDLMRSPVRRLCLALVLPVLLIFAQQAALTHEVSHLASRNSQAPKQSGKVPGKIACPECTAFAKIAGAIAENGKSPVAVIVDFLVLLQPIFTLRATELAVLRNRGPPSVL